MTGVPPDPPGTAPAAVLAVRAAGLAAPNASHLCATGRGGDPHALRHAVKVRPGAGGEAVARLFATATGGTGHLDDPALTRWLVWLGPATPPAPPSHVRLAVPDPDTDPGRLPGLARAAGIPAGPAAGRPIAGLLLPLGEGPALLVTPDERGARVLGPGGPVWWEVQVHDGTRLADPQLLLLGLVAEPHHRQVLPGIPTRQRLALLVRPEVTA